MDFGGEKKSSWQTVWACLHLKSSVIYTGTIWKCLFKLFELHFCENQKTIFSWGVKISQGKLISGFYPQLTSFRIFLDTESIFLDMYWEVFVSYTYQALTALKLLLSELKLHVVVEWWMWNSRELAATERSLLVRLPRVCTGKNIRKRSRESQSLLETALSLSSWMLNFKDMAKLELIGVSGIKCHFGGPRH